VAAFPLKKIEEEEEMAVNEEEVQLGVRLAAIEFMICELFSAAYRGADARQVHLRHDKWVNFFQKKPIEGYDPATSDLLAAELETAIRRLITKIESHVQMPRPKQKRGE
jgi:hypothetical protein